MPELFRVFPWDPAARPGEPFSPTHVPGTTGRGRFDLPARRSSVLYAAETPDHAVGEVIQRWRGGRIDARHLRHCGHDLALVAMDVAPEATEEFLDLRDPRALVRIGWPPAVVASRHRTLTQPVATAAWDAGHRGVRWWSSFWGDWHGVVLFMARLDGLIRFGEPEVLTVESPALLAAAEALGVGIVDAVSE